MFPSDKKHGAKRSIIPEKIILQQSNVSSGPALMDILDKLIRMDVVAKEAPINDENDVSHGRKLPTVPPAFPSAAFSPVLHILLSINEQISNFAQTYPTNLKASSNEALLFMRRYRFANCSCFSCCFKDAYPSSNVQ